jgi:hypothetical protein
MGRLDRLEIVFEINDLLINASRLRGLVIRLDLKYPAHRGNATPSILLD